MAVRGQSRISVVRNNEVVPLLPGHHGVERPAQPWEGMLLERHAVRASEIPEHEHREFCLHLQLTGNADFEWWSEGKHRVEHTSPGSLILLGPGTRDRLRWEGDSERLILSLDPAALRKTLDSMEIAADVEISNRWSLHDGALEHLVREMGREAEAGWPFGRLYAGLLQSEFARQLMARHAGIQALPAVKRRMPMAKLRAVFDYVYAKLDSDLSLQELAAVAGLSAYHFAREFRNTTGQAPHQYVLDQRIALAKELLRHKGAAVQDVATAVGFGSAVNFVRAFRRRVGITPGAWRDTQR